MSKTNKRPREFEPLEADPYYMPSDHEDEEGHTRRSGKNGALTPYKGSESGETKPKRRVVTGSLRALPPPPIKLQLTMKKGSLVVYFSGEAATRMRVTIDGKNLFARSKTFNVKATGATFTNDFILTHVEPRNSTGSPSEYTKPFWDIAEQLRQLVLTSMGLGTKAFTNEDVLARLSVPDSASEECVFLLSAFFAAGAENSGVNATGELVIGKPSMEATKSVDAMERQLRMGRITMIELPAATQGTLTPTKVRVDELPTQKETSYEGEIEVKGSTGRPVTRLIESVTVEPQGMRFYETDGNAGAVFLWRVLEVKVIPKPVSAE